MFANLSPLTQLHQKSLFQACYIRYINMNTWIKVGLGLGGLAGLTFLLKDYLFAEKSQSKDHYVDPPLSIEKTRQLMQQIKYQMLVVCVNYSEKMSSEMLTFIPQPQMELAKEKLREAMLKNYQNKQRIILQKHVVSTDDYASSLLAYKSDPFLTKNKNEIFLMMQKALNGQSPIMDVPNAALAANSTDSMKDIYQQMCLMVGKVVWKKMLQESTNDSSFDPDNDEHFKRAIRDINIYELKGRYLEEKGYIKEWGCPNEIFLKVTEHLIRQNPIFRFKIRTIEKAYNKLIDIVSYNPLSISQNEISQVFLNQIATLEEQERQKQRKRQVIRENQQAAAIENNSSRKESKASGQKQQEVPQ